MKFSVLQKNIISADSLLYNVHVKESSKREQEILEKVNLHSFMLLKCLHLKNCWTKVSSLRLETENNKNEPLDTKHTINLQY